MIKMKNYVFPSEAVNWEELESIGVYRDDLEKNGELEPLLNGEKTNPVNLHLMFCGIDIDLDATLQLVHLDDSYIVEIKGVSAE